MLRNNKFRRARAIPPRPGKKCQSEKWVRVNVFKCFLKITDSRRKILFKNYWTTKDQKEKWNYSARFFISKEVKTRNVVSQNLEYKTVTKNYEKIRSREFLLDLRDQKQTRVCKTMFLNTFGIKENVLKTIDDKRTLNDSFLGQDLRGKHSNKGNSVPKESYDSAREHIGSFPKVEFRYCRADTEREYFLEENLNCNIMYKLHEKWMIENKTSIRPVSLSTHRRIFNYHSGNIAFNKSKKDVCKTCKQFMNLGDQKTDADQKMIDEHISRKMQIRKIREAAILEAKKSKNVVVACFDLEKVITYLFVGKFKKANYKRIIVYSCDKIFSIITR